MLKTYAIIHVIVISVYNLYFALTKFRQQFLSTYQETLDKQTHYNTTRYNINAMYSTEYSMNPHEKELIFSLNACTYHVH